MTIEQLATYKENRFAVKQLEIEIRRMEIELKRMCEPSYVKSQRLDGMPHGTGKSDPTAQIAIGILAGHRPPEAQLFEREIERKRMELQDKQLEVLFVDAWLDMLTESERWVVQMHCLEGFSWSVTAAKSAQIFGDQRSIDTLRRLYRRALAK